MYMWYNHPPTAGQLESNWVDQLLQNSVNMVLALSYIKYSESNMKVHTGSYIHIYVTIWQQSKKALLMIM